MSKQGLLIVISGFSGSGKGTVIKELLKKDKYKFSISATTRKPRPGEEHGREYFFLTREEFESMIEEDKLIEYAQYVGNYYGTPRDYVEQQRKAGCHVILDIEIQGACEIKKQYPDALLLFITPPSAQCLKERLVGRGTEEADVIDSRMDRACEEAVCMKDYDYLVINDVVKTCAQKVDSIVDNEESRMSRNGEFLNRMQKELAVYSKGAH